jgi:hypothetical protein
MGDNNEPNEMRLPRIVVSNVGGISTFGGWDLKESSTCPQKHDILILSETKGPESKIMKKLQIENPHVLRLLGS